MNHPSIHDSFNLYGRTKRLVLHRGQDKQVRSLIIRTPPSDPSKANHNTTADVGTR